MSTTTRTRLEKILYFAKDNALYLSIWIIALSSIVMMNSLTTNSFTFIGVTESREVNINSKNAVVIKEIYVLPGQIVKEGQLMMELERPDLTHRINEVSHKLKELIAQYKLNAKLNSGLKSIRSKRNSEDEDDALTIQINSLEQELGLLHQSKEGLYVFAQFQGHVGAVNFKKGESVSPFESIMTMHKANPTLVRGFIHEKHLGNVSLNKTVKISSAGRDQETSAAITSVGTRIVELPDRFKRNATDRIWGREVIIKIPDNNGFLLGEKVYLDLDDTNRNISALNQARAIEAEPEVTETPNAYMSMTNRPAKSIIEPSGLTYIKDLNKFLLISDDTTDKKPLIYLLNKNGEFDNHVINIEGLEKINDMEAIATDENEFIYVISSQSANKKGRVTKSRKKFVKLKRDGIRLIKTAEVSLYDILARIAKYNRHHDWVRLLKDKNASKGISLDVEGMFIKNGDAYLGLRNPVQNNKEVIILKINDVDALFASGNVNRNQVSIWKTIKLPVKRISDRNEGISDLILLDGNVIILTANNKKARRGRVLHMNFKNSEEIRELAYYPDRKPEGISFSPEDNSLIIAFDNNNEDVDSDLEFTRLNWK